MKEPLEVKCDNKILGNVLKVEKTEEGIEIVFKPTDEFYKMQKDFQEAISKVRLRTIDER